MLALNFDTETNPEEEAMIQLPIPTLAMAASQDPAFQVAFSVVAFLVLSSMVWTPAAASAGETVPPVSAVGMVDPEEDYLPLEYQKPGPTPAEMEAFCPWSGVDVTEWQEILYDGHRLHA
ncbi:hypothetical protein VZG47_00130 (plasmid) [Synechococcus elongatus IITB5]